jgi:ribonuclease HII
MILGIDEVGRGAWAGPLVVGACVLNGAQIEGLTDSKALTKKRRAELAAEIAASEAIVGLGWVPANELDEIGLGAALRLATRRAVEQVQAECRARKVKFDEIIIDGTINFLENTPLEKYVSTLKKADLLILSVSAAAIAAKVARDNFMAKLGEQPEFAPYGFAGHAGYGTKKHREALQEFGVSAVHRKSFKPIAELINYKADFSDISESTEGIFAHRYGENPSSFRAPLPLKSLSENISEISFENSKQLGDFAEEKVAEFLRGEKHEILARNWRTKFCEIDIVSRKDKVFYFTEVKYRKTADFGGGEAAISNRKIEQIKFAAEFFAHQNKLDNVELQLLGAIVEGGNFEIKDIFEIE